MRRLVLPALAAALLASVALADDLSEAGPVIEAANADWIPAMKARDAGRIAGAYALDGLAIGADGSVLAGRAAVQASLQQRLARMEEVTGGGIVQDGIHLVSPGLIYEWGHGVVETVGPDGAKRSGGGRYLSVWKRGEDGVWRIARNLSLPF